MVFWAASLPAPENLVMVITAVGLGVGLGAGSGYVAWLQRTTPARIKAMQELDRAQRATTMAELKSARDEMQAEAGRIQQLSNAVDKLEKHLDEEKILNDKLRADLLEFALSVLHAKGHIEREAKETAGS